MQIRSSYPLFIERASIFLDQIIPLVRDLQFTSGGSIIAVQVYIWQNLCSDFLYKFNC